VETGVLGLLLVLFMLQQMLATSYRLLKRATDPLYRGLGLGLFVAICACMVANCFGDRWTYLEITGLLWVLVAAAIRATQFTLSAEELSPMEGDLTLENDALPVYAVVSRTNPWQQSQPRFKSTSR
jgi:O-antigen ligase